jgi:hypothetical protein
MFTKLFNADAKQLLYWGGFIFLVLVALSIVVITISLAMVHWNIQGRYGFEHFNYNLVGDLLLPLQDEI